MPNPKLKFTEEKFVLGEKVLCFHGPLIYEAKMIKSMVMKDKQVKYFIHYAGWNKNWDEWVPENRVLKYNEANVQKQKEVSKQHALAAKNKKGSSKTKKSDPPTIPSGKDSDSRASTPSKELIKETTSSGSVPSSSSRGRAGKPSTPVEPIMEGPRKKRGRLDTSVETEEQFLCKIEIKVKLPEELKPWLVDDWDAITRQHKLIDLPAKNTVQSIIDGYIQYKKTSKTNTPNKETAITDISNGLVEYFNVMLGSQLLYKFERPQYSEMLLQHSTVPMAKVYGAMHLLRLFVKLGSMLAFTVIDEKSTNLLMTHLQDFLKYMIKNSSTLFNMQHYVNTTPEYHRKALV